MAICETKTLSTKIKIERSNNLDCSHYITTNMGGILESNKYIFLQDMLCTSIFAFVHLGTSTMA